MRLPIHAYDGAGNLAPAGEPSDVKLTKARVDWVLHECAALRVEPEYFEKSLADINCASGSIRFDAAGVRHL